MAKHTPGPWALRMGSVSVFAATGEKVAEVTALKCPELKARGGTRNAEIGANLNLVAAAPDLLEFAEAAAGILAWAKDHGADPDAVRGMEHMRLAVIAKAVGRK